MSQEVTRGIAKFRADESGQTLPFAALCFAILIAFLGLAIDVGHLRAAKRHLQTAADAAALAAGLEMRVCGAANPCPTMAKATQSSLAENGYTTSSVIYNCATAPTTNLVASINFPPCALGTADPNRGKAGYLEVQLTQPVQPLFLGVFGLRSVSMSARAEVRHGGGPCIYALDPNGANAITVAASLTSTCGIVDESTNASAFSCLLGAISAPQITIAGGATKLLCSTSPKARTGAPLPTPADPLKYLTPPVIPACGPANPTGPTLHGSSTLLPLSLGVSPTPYVLYPDKAYCGGISIGPGAKVTFMPGIYVIKSTTTTNGGLSINLLATVSGAGVTFYNFGPNGNLSLTGTGLSAITLSAPTSGPTSGILYWQDVGNVSSSYILASSTGTSLQGGFYLPSATLSYLLATPSPYTLLVAKDINFTAALTLRADFSSLTSGSPLNNDSVQMVE